MISKRDFNRLWVALVASFPNAPELPEATFEAYYAALSQYPPEAVDDGFKRFIRNSGSDFFPSLPVLIKWVAEPLRPHTEVEAAVEKAIRVHRTTMAARVEFMLDVLENFQLEAGDDFDGNRHVFAREWVHSSDPWRDRWRWQLEPAQKNGHSLCEHKTKARNINAAGIDVARGYVCAACIAHVIQSSDLRAVFPDHFVHHLLNSFRKIAGAQKALVASFPRQLEAGDEVEVD